MGSGFDRSELLRRAGGALFLLPGIRMPVGLLREATGNPAVASGITVEQLVSRPDLKAPLLTVSRPGGDVGPGLLFLAPSSGPGDRGAMIAGDDGRLVWFQPVAGKTVTDFKVQRYEGRAVLTWWEGTISKQGLGKGEWVVMDDAYRELFRLHAARGRDGDLHEFQITRAGTALVTSTELRSWRHGKLVGGVVQELSLPEGRLLFEWRSLDHVPVEETAISARPGPLFDYFHVNSVDVDPNGDLLISARNTWGVYSLDRRSGRVRWRLGGKRSDFAMGPGTRFYWQHDARSHSGDRITIFDDGAAPPEERRSRALTLQLDFDRRRATLVQAFVHGPQLVLTHYMGNNQLLPNGHHFVGWGGSPFATEFDAAGATVFDAQLPHGGQSYRAFRFPWSARPATDPTLVRAQGGLYASWNGATEVRSWVLHEGPDPTGLVQTRVAQSTGFETRLDPASPAGFAAVAALDAGGRELGRSATVAP